MMHYTNATKRLSVAREPMTRRRVEAWQYIGFCRGQSVLGRVGTVQTGASPLNVGLQSFEMLD
jgi:hypothetical protein